MRAIACWSRPWVIPATDNRQQENQDIQAYYRAIGQPTVPYSDHVEKLDAAISKWRPQVVIACWVTHRLEAERPEAGGSATGVDEAAIVAACAEYIVIGNERVHAGKPIWARTRVGSRVKASMPQWWHCLARVRPGSMLQRLRPAC